ncbi:2-iminoacetate synthase ThiH [Paenibacillus sp. EC2-1]|uniref:2-iminoacetate synthase ThiH n=1 Tax=Paenibacillus sp. EC2-1 TaxID=3388665 RepID=UPI003BEEB614
MSFYDIYTQVKEWPFERFTQAVSNKDVERVLGKDRLTNEDYLTLLSPAAEPYIEIMAQQAHERTVQHFGRIIQLYQPLYLSDYCVNTCKYCSFSIDNEFPRRKLTMLEVEQEARAIKAKGIKQIILLTGESRIHSSVQYLKDCVDVLKHHFASIAIEIQPLDVPDYQELVNAGIDGLTVYQEVYDEEIYKDIHVKGPKRNYRYRLDAPERGCQAGMRAVNIGALLGLSDWQKESFITGLHAAYLQNKYLGTEISVSFPRMRPHAGEYQPSVIVTDRNLVQAMLALRLYLPRAGITISTREEPRLRDHLIPLGVTKMSAASSTVVGGYYNPSAEEPAQSQFEISDERSVADIKALLREKGYQPVIKDWQMV